MGQKGFMVYACLLGTCLVLLFVASLAGCSLVQTDPAQAAKETSLKETELEVNVKQTLLARQATDQGPSGTLEAQKATLRAQAAQATQAAMDATVAAGGAIAPNVDPTQAAQMTAQFESFQQTQGAIQAQQTAAGGGLAQTPGPLSPEDLRGRMQSANILLYEDMVARLDTNRYVKDTLERMGLHFKDDGNAVGWLKNDMESSTSWDLVIIAAEEKSQAPGEFFTYALNALDKGSSVIMEVWYLDKAAYGTASSLLDRCGLAFGLNWQKIPPAQMVMYPLDPSSPILNEPNSGISFTDVMSYWWDPTGKIAYDVGDLMKLASGGDAHLLLGTIASDRSSHGTLSSCMGGRLILQTFSSHSLTFNSGTLLWENMIYNALRTRFSAVP
jgi:hypothetical protein